VPVRRYPTEDAAANLVERLVSTVDGHTPAEGDDASEPSPDGAGGPVDELVAGWARLWRESITSLAGVVVDGTVGPDGPGLQVGAPHAAPLRLACAPGGPSAELEVWIHNPTEHDHPGLRVHVTPPCAHDGKPLDAVVEADPEVLDLPPRSGRGVRLRVDGSGAAAGTYRGLVLVDGLPDQWLALEVQVDGEAP
jgi:hypothetical protein